MSSCIFCDMVAGHIPVTKVYEDENVLAFKDIHPVAPVHLLFIPKKHISSLLDLDESDSFIISEIMLAVKKVVIQLGLDSSGFRVVNNIGKDGGQTVFHIHFHVLGGRKMLWPPG